MFLKFILNSLWKILHFQEHIPQLLYKDDLCLSVFEMTKSLFIELIIVAGLILKSVLNNNAKINGPSLSP